MHFSRELGVDMFSEYEHTARACTLYDLMQRGHSIESNGAPRKFSSFFLELALYEYKTTGKLNVEFYSTLSQKPTNFVKKQYPLSMRHGKFSMMSLN